MSGLLKRLKDVVSSEAHDLIDSHESPDKIARQLVREATEKVAAAQDLTVEAIASEKQFSQQFDEHKAKLEESQKSAETALDNGDEVGARRALENKLHHQKMVDTLAPQLERAKSNSASLKEQLSSLQKQLSTLKSEKLAIEARFKGASATDKMEKMSAKISEVDDMQDRLDRASSKVSAMEARNEAVSEVNAAMNPTAAIDSEASIEAEMKLLREKMGK